MSEMPLWMGDKGEQAQGLPKVQNQAGYKEIKEDLNWVSARLSAFGLGNISYSLNAITDSDIEEYIGPLHPVRLVEEVVFKLYQKTSEDVSIS
jgi:hypothetical protein